MTNKFEKVTDALAFMIAGKYTVTIKSEVTGNHFTYKITQGPEDNKDMYFVKVLTGPDNSWNGDWMYIGYIVPTPGASFQLMAGRKGRSEAPSFGALSWVMKNFTNANRTNDTIGATLTIQHAGKCGKCGRKLTDPVSIETGLGPICRSA